MRYRFFFLAAALPLVTGCAPEQAQTGSSCSAYPPGSAAREECWARDPLNGRDSFWTREMNQRAIEEYRRGL